MEQSYKEKYEQALSKAKDMLNYKEVRREDMEYLFPELAESEDERIRKELIELVRHSVNCMSAYKFNERIAWLEKQENRIKLSDSAYTSNGDVIEFADKYSHTVWEKLMEKFKKIENYSIGCNEVSDIVLNAIINTYNWIEKQGKHKPVISDDALREGIAHFGITQYQIDNWLKKYVDGEKQGEKKASYTTIVETGDGGINALVTRELPTDSEQNHIDKVEPKFHEGQWITNGDYTWKIVEVKPYDYILQSQDGNMVDDTISHVDEQFHSFTIQDAKDGDVLAFKNNIGGIIICKSPTDYDTGSYCRLVNDNLVNKEESGWDSTLLVPATKEQRDALMKAMADAGYTFDFERKELKKITQKSEENKGNIGGISPNWSEEDEEILDEIIVDIEVLKEQERTKDGKAAYQKEIDWLKSLRPQK